MAGRDEGNHLITGASGKRYTVDEAFVEWCRLVVDKSNKKTFGNQLQSAAEVYGYNLEDHKDYVAAAQHGYRNYAKFKDLALVYFNKKGVSVGVVFDTILARMATSANPIWVMLVADIMGMRDIRSKIKRAAGDGGGQELPPMKQYNFFNYEQRRKNLTDSGIDKLNTGELIDVLVEGGNSERQGNSMGVHSEEFSGSDSEN